MSQTEQILDGFRESQGWSDATILDLALTYIENQGSPEAWQDYLTSLKEVDDDLEDLMDVEGTPEHAAAYGEEMLDDEDEPTFDRLHRFKMSHFGTAAVCQNCGTIGNGTNDEECDSTEGLTVRASHGKVFNVRYEQRYGLSGRPIGTEKTLAFYDATYIEKFPPHGQFVSDYLPRSLEGLAGGLDLDGGVDAWAVDAHTMSVVMDWLHEQQEKESSE